MKHKCKLVWWYLTRNYRVFARGEFDGPWGRWNAAFNLVAR
jgi:hypothetical protein